MSEAAHEAYPPNPAQEPGEVHVFKPAETAPETPFQLLPHDTLSDGDLAIRRAGVATMIKEDLQNFSRLDDIARMHKEVQTEGDYIWAILDSLGMVSADAPDELYRDAFAKARKDAETVDVDRFGDIMDKFENHPTLGFLDTVTNTSPRTRIINTTLVMMRRTLLVLLDEHSQ